MIIETEDVITILAPLRPLAVYLFGSVGSDRSRPDSDLDLAFVPGARCDPYDVFLAAQELARCVGRQVDLVDLSRASAVMKAEVLRTGRRLFVADAVKVDEFEMYALSDYARTNEERREVVKIFEADHREK